MKPKITVYEEKRDAMTRAQITEIIKGILGHDVHVHVNPEATYVNATGMYGSLNVDYDAMLALSQALNTTSINIRCNLGWSGTEDTPGDTGTCEMVIGVGARY